MILQMSDPFPLDPFPPGHPPIIPPDYYDEEEEYD